MHTSTKVTLLTLGLVVAAVMTAQSQSASINVTAAVQQPITVSATSNLVFGNVFPGVAKPILVSDAGAGHFTVAGQANAPVSMTFVLPTNLVNGGNNLPIATWTGNWNGTATPTGTSFTPSASATAATLSGVSALHVYVGATVTPTVVQVAGSYTGSVTLTVTY